MKSFNSILYFYNKICTVNTNYQLIYEFLNSLLKLLCISMCLIYQFDTERFSSPYRVLSLSCLGCFQILNHNLCTQRPVDVRQGQTEGSVWAVSVFYCQSEINNVLVKKRHNRARIAFILFPPSVSISSQVAHEKLKIFLFSEIKFLVRLLILL